YRINESETGTGIGLALTQELVKLHGGSIKLNSQVGEGSEFIVQIPLVEGEYPEFSLGVTQEISRWHEYKVEQPEIVASTQDQNNEKPLALIVEDNEELRNFMVNAFQPAYRVSVAENGMVGFHEAVKIIPDVIITDWMMPEMSGEELCKKIKTHEATS